LVRAIGVLRVRPFDVLRIGTDWRGRSDPADRVSSTVSFADLSTINALIDIVNEGQNAVSTETLITPPPRTAVSSACVAVTTATSTGAG